MVENLKLPSKKQAEVVKSVKRLLALAHAGRIIAVGYAVLNFDEDGDVSAGTDAVWADSVQVREGLRTSVRTLEARIAAKSAIILNS